MEEYVAEVVQGETSGQMPPEALTAMAVAARTYATRFRQRHKSEGFDFCDTTHCQYVKTDISPAVSTAVRRSRGEILWLHGRPFAAYYHKDCGGRTESAADAWAAIANSSSISQNDPYCVRVSQPWRVEISRDDIAAALKAAGLHQPENWNRIAILNRTPSGRAKTLLLAVGNSQGGIPVSASSFRFALGRRMGWGLLKSDLYKVTGSGDHLIFRGRGVGHGVGLCQTGAAEMASEGKSYREILAFYYPGTTVSVAAAGIEWQIISKGQVDVKVADGSSSEVAKIAPSALAWAESHSGFRAVDRPSVYVYPDVKMFRDSTGEPGWVAASTKGDQIRIQPPHVLGSRLESVLRHEFLHFLVESNSSPGTPLWYREGLVMLFAGESSEAQPLLPPQKMEEIFRQRRDERKTQRAYASAIASVARLERRYGRAELIRWLRRGIPPGVLDRSSFPQESSHDR
jgi:stage II sporulation protein D